VRNLYQNAGAVTGARIGTDSAAMFEVAENRKRVLYNPMGFAALDVGNESNATGILVERRIIETLRRRQAVCGSLAHLILTIERHRRSSLNGAPYDPLRRSREAATHDAMQERGRLRAPPRAISCLWTSAGARAPNISGWLAQFRPR